MKEQVACVYVQQSVGQWHTSIADSASYQGANGCCASRNVDKSANRISTIQ